jgi:hypothetical protein
LAKWVVKPDVQIHFGPEKILITAYSISVFWDKKGSWTQLAAISVGNSHSQFGSCLASDYLSESMNYTRLSRFNSSSNPKASNKSKTGICEKSVQRTALRRL